MQERSWTIEFLSLPQRRILCGVGEIMFDLLATNRGYRAVSQPERADHARALQAVVSITESVLQSAAPDSDVTLVYIRLFHALLLRANCTVVSQTTVKSVLALLCKYLLSATTSSANVPGELALDCA